ncbi:conserved phage C-terminal domain-containing protein [Neobacillus niacini]|uniref:conserved phage C-terminal domain-containing protein n=1 Tax=Neobacillus niacini TaxID=86668 RepID=UPI0039832B65
MDKTKWYSIDYEKLKEFEDTLPDTRNQPVEEPAPKEESEKSIESTVHSYEKKEIPYAEIISYLNEKTGKSFKLNSIKTRELIHARYGEGFTLEDFTKVIDLKAADWQSDHIWNKFLRPETLFGTKFESYLNQQNDKKRMIMEDFNLDE